MSSYVSSLSSSSYSGTSLMSGTITFSGLGNGTDFTDIIEATMDIERTSLDNYEEELVEAQNAVTLLESLNTSLTSLESTLKTMDEMDEFLAFDVSSNGDCVEATAEGSAQPGTHTIIVNQLAQNDVWVNESLAFADTADVIASNATTFGLSYGGESYSLDVAAGTTINGLVDQINSNSDMGQAVTASLIFDGSSYHLSLAGNDMGADNTITIDDVGTLSGFDTADFVNTQTAQNAQIKVDGYPSTADTWIERDTNTIDDVITGIELELTDVTSATGERISISYDEDAMRENIETFVTEVNQIILDLQTITGRTDTDYTDEGDDDEEDDTYVLNDYSLDAAYNILKNDLSTSAIGFTYFDEETGLGDLFTSLSQIGISTDADPDSDTYGQLVLDDDELDDALAKDPYAVAALFAESGTPSSDSSDVTVLSTIDGLTQPGEHAIEYTVSGGVITSATINGKNVTIDGNTLLALSDNDANGLYVQINNLTDGSYSSTVSMKQGKVGELVETLDGMTNDDTGSIAILIESYESSVSGLESQIASEEARLETKEANLQARYARLDVTLQNYDSIASQLDSLLPSTS